MNKIVKPTMPMSIEEHDKEVNRAWREENLKPYKTADDYIEEFYSELGIVLQRCFTRCDHYFDPAHCGEMFLLFFNLPNSETKMRLIIRCNSTYELTIYKEDEHASTGEQWLYTNFEDARKKMLEFVAICNGEKEIQAEEYSCEYCCDGNANECVKSILKEDLCLEKTPIADIDIYIDENNELSLLVSNTSDMPIIHSTMKIKCCPMCGRELKINGGD